MKNKSHRPSLTKEKITNTKRIGVNHFAISEIYSAMVTMSWVRFFLFIFLTYLSLTILFTLAYAITGFEHFNGLSSSQFMEKFWIVFFYNAQTLSTVGGAGITPVGMQNNLILTIESMTAMLGMAIITGLLYFRFSKPIAEIIYSNNALVSPYREGKALMIRIANGRKNELVGMTATVYIKINDVMTAKREVKQLTLERSDLPFLASTWTIVHPIEKESPLFKLDLDNQENIQYEISIWLDGIDGATGQNVFSSNTYLYRDIMQNAKFLPCMDVDDNGKFHVHLNRVSDCEIIK